MTTMHAAIRETTDAEMLAAVERWARARGIWEQPPGESRRWSVRWHFSAKDARLEIRCWRPDGVVSWTVDPHTALLWACTVETTETLTSPPIPSEAEARAWAAARVMSGRMEILRPSGVSARRPGEPREFVARVTRPLAVDVGKCPACVNRGGRFEWSQAVGVVETGLLNVFASRHSVRDGWTVVAFRAELVAGKPVSTVASTERRGFMLVCVASRPCPDCRGTGRDLREVARLVLDAAPRERIESDLGDAHVLAWLIMQDRAALHVEADRLQTNVPPCGLCNGKGTAWAVDAVGPGVTTEQANPRKVVCMVCEGRRVDEHGDAQRSLGEWIALWLAGKADAAGEMVAWLGERTTQGTPVTTPRPVAVRWSGLHPDEFPGSDFP